MKHLTISPPLLNSANPWCTTLEQLQDLYNCSDTGAVTTRTSLLNGFPHDPSVHQYTFYDPTTLSASSPNTEQVDTPDTTASLNTLGYSPLPLQEYLQFIHTISDSLDEPVPGKHYKPFIISVTGSVDEVVQCYRLISTHQQRVRMPLAMEVNLSCPNIPGKPPPAYSSASLYEYLCALKAEMGQQQMETAHPRADETHVVIGIKTPPYTYHDQFQNLVDALLRSVQAPPTHLPCPLSFITATNTLGSSLLLAPQIHGAETTLHRAINSANGIGIGGLAGAPLHPLALGNVYTIKGLLSQHRELEGIQIIGVGGVEDVHGYQRMRAADATAVAVGTALGRKGVRVFSEIGQALDQH